MTSVKAVLFDLDGTLLDSAPDLVDALNKVRGSEGLEPLPVNELKRYASRGAVGLLRAAMPEAGPRRFEQWRAAFLDHYERALYQATEFFPGIPELLDFLADKALPVGLVTNKFENLTIPILERSGLSSHLTCVVCGDTLPRSKPHPDPVLLACRMLGKEPPSVVFVGDDVRDIQAGRAAGTRTAAVMYGYGSHEFTEEWLEGSVRIAHPAELRNWIEQVNRRQAHG